MIILDCQYLESLRQASSAIKPVRLALAALIGLWPAPSAADFRQPCPELTVTPSCGPTGGAEVRLAAPRDMPKDLRLLISGQGGGGTYLLTAGQSVALPLPGAPGDQTAVTVVGLEGAGATTEGCCFSSHRLRRPDCGDAPQDPARTAERPDFALTLTLPEICPREGCIGQLDILGPAGEPQTVTLETETRAQITAAACLSSPPGAALCDVPTGTGIEVTFVPDPAAPAGKAELCGELGIGGSAAIRTLALQKALARHGYDPGPLDGQFGAATRAALDGLAGDAGLPPLTDEVPAELLDLLGLAGFSDANPGNDRACAQTTLPRPALACDPATTRAAGLKCVCRFKGMRRADATSCACPKGTRLGPEGCVKIVDKPDGSTTGTRAKDPACDPETTVLRRGKCQCRSASMVRVSPTRCEPVPEPRLCPNGLPEMPGIGCAVFDRGCSRRNDAGECCDDRPAGDTSCP